MHLRRCFHHVTLGEIFGVAIPIPEMGAGDWEADHGKDANGFGAGDTEDPADGIAAVDLLDVLLGNGKGGGKLPGPVCLLGWKEHTEQKEVVHLSW